MKKGNAISRNHSAPSFKTEHGDNKIKAVKKKDKESEMSSSEVRHFIMAFI